METQELNQLSKDELTVRLRQAREKFFHVQQQVLTGKDKNHAQLSSLRRQVARICTILSHHS